MSFTIVSLATGFKGGEVTPLFYIGATLGNALAPLLHMPFAFMAGIGFVAVFAGAANTPLATTFMAMELFGTEMAVFSALGCFTAYLFQAIPEFIMPSESVMQKVANTARLSRQTCVFLKFPLLAGRSIPLYPLTKTKYKKTRKMTKSHNGEF